MNANESTKSHSDVTGDTRMSAERSIEIIRQSIEQSRIDTNRVTGMPLVMWGTLVFLTALVVGHMLNATGSAWWQLLWLAAGVAGAAGQSVIGRRTDISACGYAGKVVGMIWLSFAVFCFSMFVIVPLAVLINQHMGVGAELSSMPVTAIITAMMCLCAMLTGLVMKNAWITTGAIVAGIGCTAFALAMPGAYAMIAMAMASLLALIVPGVVILAGARS